MGRYATGVSLIVTSTPDGPRGLTANSLTSVSLDPMLILFCLNNGSRTGAYIRQSRRFSVNILGRHQEKLSRLFAGEKCPASTAVEWVQFRGAPVLADAEAVLLCDLREEHRGGDHSIMIGAVTAMTGRQLPRAPLIFYRGKYSTVAPSITHEE